MTIKEVRQIKALSYIKKMLGLTGQRRRQYEIIGVSGQRYSPKYYFVWNGEIRLKHKSSADILSKSFNELCRFVEYETHTAKDM